MQPRCSRRCGQSIPAPVVGAHQFKIGAALPGSRGQSHQAPVIGAHHIDNRAALPECSSGLKKENCRAAPAAPVSHTKRPSFGAHHIENRVTLLECSRGLKKENCRAAPAAAVKLTVPPLSAHTRRRSRRAAPLQPRSDEELRHPHCCAARGSRG